MHRRNAKQRSVKLTKTAEGMCCRGHVAGFSPTAKRIPVPGCVKCDAKLAALKGV